jgi:outer membrane protein assembly factor BamB
VGQCIDANTGDIIWKKRLAGSYSASPFVVADEVFFTSREGVTTVLKTDGSSEVVRQNQLEARLMATPVVLDRQLLIRGDEHLYSIE